MYVFIYIGLNDEAMGLQPIQEYVEMSGGRMYPFPEKMVCICNWINA